jgi:uncharacterized protein YbcV (DUF1398 family)
MDDHRKDAARRCLAGAENNTMSFPEIVGKLTQEGFDGYTIDYRRATATYYLPDGDSVELSTHTTGAPIVEAFDVATVRAAIREAQQMVPDYTYRGFCTKVTAAGCAGYMVSFPGRRVLYFGRTAETHVERFPD